MLEGLSLLWQVWPFLPLSFPSFLSYLIPFGGPVTFCRVAGPYLAYLFISS